MAGSVVGVLEEGFELITKNYLKFLLLYALITLFFFIIIIVAVIALFALGAFSTSMVGNASAPPSSIVFIFVFFMIVLLGVVFLIEPIWLGTYYSMALQGLKGKISLTYALQQAEAKYIPLLWTAAIEGLIVVVIDAIIFSPLIIPALNLVHVIAASGTSGPAVTSAILGLGLVAIVLVFVYLLVSAILSPILYEAVPLVMLEGISGVKAIGESIDIGKKHFWSILILIIGVGLVAFGINIITGILVDIVQFINYDAGALLNLLIYLFVSAFIAAWVNALPIIFYEDYIDQNPPNKASK